MRGENEINLHVGKILSRFKFKVGKYFLIKIKSNSLSYECDELKIAEETALEGLYTMKPTILRTLRRNISSPSDRSGLHLIFFLLATG